KTGHQRLYWSHPRKFGQGSRSCCICSNQHSLTCKYSLSLCPSVSVMNVGQVHKKGQGCGLAAGGQESELGH
ncbi:hypothetical protein HPG69_002396, partial [Diceros bicornis minor]